MLCKLPIFILWKNNIALKEKNLLGSVYRDENVWPNVWLNVWLKAWVEDPVLGLMSNFFGNAFHM